MLSHPTLIVRGAADAIDFFYQRAFGAEEVMRMPGPGGNIMHAEIKIGDSPVMLADEMPETDFQSPSSLGGSPVGILRYVQDVDRCFEQAVEAGGATFGPLADQF